MNYKKSLKYLNSFINYEKTPPLSHAELNLERMHAMLGAIDYCEGKFFPILIAGTVGKGSSGFFLEQILKASKISCGFYHSPHVDNIRERIRINGEMVSEKKWSSALSFLFRKLKKNPISKQLGKPTFFEIMTLLAIKVFTEEGLKIGIFEIGMGGRLDATNVLDAPLCILTKIDFDHQAFLGKTLTAIAREKAGIIKSARVVVCAPQKKEVLKVFKDAVRKNGSKIIWAKATSFQPGLSGEFQKQNAGNAIVAAQALKKYFEFKISKTAIKQGAQKSDWSGRLEKVSYQGRKMILDAAHNPAGCYKLAAFLKTAQVKPSWIIFGALQDKDSGTMLKILSKLKTLLIVTPVQNPRSKTAKALNSEAAKKFDRIVSVQNSRQALMCAFEQTKRGETILVTGSFYLVGEIRQMIRNSK